MCGRRGGILSSEAAWKFASGTVFCQKKCCFKQNQNVPHENVFVLQLATVQRIWSPAALFNDQILLGEIRHGGVARWWLLCFSCKENFRMLRFPTVQRIRLDLPCHLLIQPFLKNYLPSPVHIIKVLYFCIYFMEAWGPCLSLRQVRLSHWSCTRDAFGPWGLKITVEIFTAYLCGTETTQISQSAVF